MVPPGPSAFFQMKVVVVVKAAASAEETGFDVHAYWQLRFPRGGGGQVSHSAGCGRVSGSAPLLPRADSNKVLVHRSALCLTQNRCFLCLA